MLFENEAIFLASGGVYPIEPDKVQVIPGRIGGNWQEYDGNPISGYHGGD